MALDLKDLARRGAAARAAELQAELAAIRKAFPGLSAGNIDAPSTRRLTGARKRKPMSAAQKAEVSKRMTRYWAARRKAEAR